MVSHDDKYCINFPDGSSVYVVKNTPSVGEIDEATVQAVKHIMSSFPGAKVVGSVDEIK